MGFVRVENATYNTDVVGGLTLNELKEMFPDVSQPNIKKLSELVSPKVTKKKEVEKDK